MHFITRSPFVQLLLTRLRGTKSREVVQPVAQHLPEMDRMVAEPWVIDSVEVLESGHVRLCG